MALFTVVVWGGFLWLSTRLREIRMTKDKFIIRNMFGSTEIYYGAYKGLQKGIWPSIFEIKFSDRTYPFSIRHHTFIWGFFRSNEVLDLLTKEVEDHFNPKSDGDTQISDA